jgi:hypothetical protein
MPTVSSSERILVVGGDDSLRDGLVAELRDSGWAAEGRAGLLEDAEGAHVVLVAGAATRARSSTR